MQDLDIDGIMKVMSNPEVGTNIESVMGALDEVNKVLSKFDKTVQMLDKMGLKPLIVRALGVKIGVDAETPLKSEKVGIIPQTNYHEIVFNQLNQLTEEQIASVLANGAQKTAEVENESTEANIGSSE